MGDEPEYIFEGSPPRLPLSRFLTPRTMIALVLAIASVGVTFLVKPGPVRHPLASAPSSSSVPIRSPTPTPTPSPTPSSIGGRLIGIGPFVIVQIGDSSSPFVAIDLGSPNFKHVILGTPPGQGMGSDSSIQAWGRVASIASQTDTGTSVWFLAKGRGFDDPPLVVPDGFDRSLTSPDGKQMILVRTVPNDGNHADIIVVPTDGSPTRTLERILTGGSKNEEGILTPIAWLPGGGWLALPICQCSGRGPVSWYTISTRGLVTKATWLGSPDDGSPGVSEDGRYLSFFDQPAKDCGNTQDPTKMCPTGPTRILLADTMTHHVRVLAESPNDVLYRSTAISPDGSLVAAPVGGSHSVQILDAKSGRVLATVSSRRDSLSAVAFTDDSRLLLMGQSDTNEFDALFLAHVEFGQVRMTELARNLVPIAGWVR